MQLTNKLIPFVKYTLIVCILLTPQKAYCQFSDSTIREINLRLIELHECRQKQSLYKVLADNDGKLIHRQDSIIQELTIATNKEKVAKIRYQTLSAFSSLMLLLALIL
jgi:hypothetical protein